MRLYEAKIYDGFAYHISGLDQLLDRYLTGREGGGLLIEFVKKKNIKELLLKVRNQMDAEFPSNQSQKSTDHTIKWSFLTTHSHSSGEDINIQHIGCNLFQEESETV